MADDHNSFCDVWETIGGTQRVNNARKCTCGFRDRVTCAQQDMTDRRRHGVRPLGMTDADFLRSNGIKPDGV